MVAAAGPLMISMRSMSSGSMSFRRAATWEFCEPSDKPPGAVDPGGPVLTALFTRTPST